jgi:hypothetical protein
MCRLAVLPVASCLLLAVPTGASAQEAPTATIEPTTGPPGTTVTVSGSGCPSPSWGDYSWSVHVQVRRSTESPSSGQVAEPTGEEPRGPVGFTAEGYTGRADADAAPAEDGSWTVRLTIPGAQDNFPAVAGEYPISALCYAEQGLEAGSISYGQPVFTVTGAAEPSESPFPLPLARTGSNGMLALGAILSIAVGVVLSIAARRMITRRS